MRNINVVVLAAVAIYLLAGPLSAGQGSKGSGGTVRQEIKALTDETIQANLKGDASFFEKHYADDAVIVRSDGKMSTKAQDVAALKSGAVKYETYDVHDQKILVYGNTAVVSTLLTFKGTISGKPWGGEVRSTRVWTKQKGDWKLIAFQSTRVVSASQ